MKRKGKRERGMEDTRNKEYEAQQLKRIVTVIVIDCISFTDTSLITSYSNDNCFKVLYIVLHC